MDLKLIRRFEDLLEDKLVQIVKLVDHDYNRTYIFTDQVKLAYDWCGRHGIAQLWDLHECVQVYEKGKNVIAKVLVHTATSCVSAYFIVPLELVEKSLLLDSLPD